MKEIFEIKDKSLAGRIGEIKTAHGKIQTPTLFPVINPIRQEISLEDIKKIGFNSIITNAYMLKKHKEKDVLKKGVHGYFNFTGPIMTDSGGYQILEYGGIEITPKEIVEFQEAIGSDIAVILDIPTGGYASYDEAKLTVDETIQRAIESLKYMRSNKTLWVFPIQGGRYLDLLAKHARKFLELPYDIVSIGSPTQILEKYEYHTLVHMIATVKQIVPSGVPIHLFGAGHPMFMPFAIALGVDTFDSASYMLYAKDDRLIFPFGTLRLNELSEIPCSCPICTKYTVNELVSLEKKEREKLLAFHNLYILRQEIKRIKEAIRENTLWDLIEERSRCYPSLYKAFKELSKYKYFLEKYHPTTKVEISGIFLYDKHSLNRPEILRHKYKILNNYVPPKEIKEAIVFLDFEEKPFTRTKVYDAVRKRKDIKTHILAFMPYFGLIPEELSETYPLSQHEKTYDETVILDSLEILYKYFKKYENKYAKITLISNRSNHYLNNILKTLSKFIKEVELLTYSNDVEEVVRRIK